MERYMPPEMQPEEEKSPHIPMVPIKDQKQMDAKTKMQTSPPSPPSPPGPGGGPGKGPLADVVYVYVSPDKPGIWFYDRTPRGPGADFAGSYPDGKYVTDAESIFEANWNDEVNIPNGAIRERFREGGRKVITHMVSPEQMQEIVEGIQNAKNKKRIVIDTRELSLRINDEVAKIYDDFLEERKKVFDGEVKEFKKETDSLKPNQMPSDLPIDNTNGDYTNLKSNDNMIDISDIPPVNIFKK